MDAGQAQRNTARRLASTLPPWHRPLNGTIGSPLFTGVFATDEVARAGSRVWWPSRPSPTWSPCISPGRSGWGVLGTLLAVYTEAWCH
jgi:hypothetical protein